MSSDWWRVCQWDDQVPHHWRWLARNCTGFWTSMECSTCDGTIDGKHVAISKPINSGSLYYNTKQFFLWFFWHLWMLTIAFCGSILVVKDTSDAQIFNESELKETVESGEISFPPPEPMTNDNEWMPFFMIWDNAFTLCTTMMVPYSRKNHSRSERIFNYRISCARRLVENAFGILAARFQCLFATLQQNPVVVRDIIEAGVSA